MAKNSPVKICSIKHNPSKDPKFHQIEMFRGVGKYTSELLTTLKIGCVFILFFINFSFCVRVLSRRL